MAELTLNISALPKTAAILMDNVATFMTFSGQLGGAVPAWPTITAFGVGGLVGMILRGHWASSLLA